MVSHDFVYAEMKINSFCSVRYSDEGGCWQVFFECRFNSACTFIFKENFKKKSAKYLFFNKRRELQKQIM